MVHICNTTGIVFIGINPACKKIYLLSCQSIDLNAMPQITAFDFQLSRIGHQATALHLNDLLRFQLGGDILECKDFSILVDHRFLRSARLIFEGAVTPMLG